MVITCWPLLLLLLSCLFSVEAADYSTAEVDDGEATSRGRLVKNSQPRIVNGTDAPVGRYPYVVSLQKIFPEIKHFCGGSLIAPDIVLTAAHCFTEGADVAARINPHNRDDPLTDSEIFPIRDSIVHPLYRSQNENDHDIRIIHLDGQSKATPIRLNDDEGVPILYEQLAVAGWGVSKFGADQLSAVLQYADDHVTHISNEECVETTLQGDQGSYFTSAVTEDMMCALEPGQGSCQGDSGGPLFIQGGDAEEDIQVGIVSWGADCAQPFYPGVFARVSWAYDWIREEVCRLSQDPPDHFRCKNDVDAPTAAPPQLNVFIKIQLDSYPAETGWAILDDRDEVVQDMPSGTYDAAPCGSTVSELISLDEGGTYTFILKDGFGDGTSVPLGGAFVFLGDTEDYTKILVFLDGNFNKSVSSMFEASDDATFSIGAPTTTPTVTVSPSLSDPPSLVPTMTNMPTYSTQIVTVLINFDTYSSVTLSWRITTVDNVVIKEVPRGTYSPFDGDEVIETVKLEWNQTYVFSIIDRDGICCGTGEGYAAIFLGDSKNRSNVLMWEQGVFQFSRSRTFITSANATFERTLTPTSSPSISPPPTISATPTLQLVDIVIQLRFDSFPSDIGWKVVSSSGDVVAEVPVGGYSLTSCFDIVNEVVAVRSDGQYILAVLDKSGDGLCCRSGAGFIAVYYEEISDGSVLLFLQGEFEAELNGTFVASQPKAPILNMTGTEAPVPPIPKTTEAPVTTPGPTSPADMVGKWSKASMTLAGVSIFCCYILL